MTTKNTIKRMIAMILCLILVCSLFTACGSKEEDTKVDNTTANTDTSTTNDNEDSSTDDGNADDTVTEDTAASDVLTELTLPLCEETEELDVWTLFVNDYVEDPNEIRGVQEIEKRTNVHINWTPVTILEMAEKFGLMLASGDIPDIVYAPGTTYPGGDVKAIEDGLFMDCTELVAKYMPNYRAFLESDPTYKKDVMTDTGIYAGIFGINSADDGTPKGEDAYIGLAIRKDMLDKWGLAVPETIDEWYNVLTTAKNNGVEAPLMVGPTGNTATSAFMTAYGVMPGWYQENGVVKYGAVEEGYREWLEMMRKWFAEGLIDANFLSSNGMYPDPSYIATDNALAFTTLHIYTSNMYSLYGMSTNPEINVIAVPNPVMNKGDQVESSYAYLGAVGNMIRISASCENPELAVKWLDYMLTTEAMMYNFYGVEGESYTMVDGVPNFTDNILNPTDYPSASAALSIYARGNGLGRYNLEAEKRQQPAASALLAGAQATWNSMDTSKAMPVRMTMTEEESLAYTNLYTAISTLQSETVINVIMGVEPMEKYDEMVEKLYEYGLEECMSYQQAALDRYNQRGQ